MMAFVQFVTCWSGQNTSRDALRGTSPVVCKLARQQNDVRGRGRGRVSGGPRVGRTIVCTSSDASSPESGTKMSPGEVGVGFMPLESNTFVFRTKRGKRVVVDPWLVGTLTFGEMKGFYEAKKEWIADSEKGRQLNVDVEHFDAILLSQGLPDHAHPPTLRKLDKKIPVFAQPQAAALCRELGYSSVQEIDHAQTVTILDGELKVTAFQGALVGPPWSKRQNAYLLDFVEMGVRVFYEPHADVPIETFRDDWARSRFECEVAILPVKRASIPVLGDYPLVKGGDSALEIVQVISPKVFVPLENDPYEASGWLGQFLSSRGEIPEFTVKAKARSLHVERVLPGTEVDLARAVAK